MGINNRLLSFNTTRAAGKTKTLGGRDRQTDRQTAVASQRGRCPETIAGLHMQTRRSQLLRL
jgi:hypothetical protein